MLKGKAVSITETLTKDPMGKLNEAQKAYALGMFGLVMAKYSLKMKKILQDKPMSTLINTCYK